METVLKSTCEGLAEQGYDVTVICSNDKPKFEKEIINGVKILRSPTIGVLFSQPLSFFMPIFLIKHRKKYDVIHIHSPNPIIEFTMIFVKHFKIFSTHHSDIINQKFLNLFYNPIYKIFLNKVSKIFVPTTNHIRYSKSVKKYKEKCEIVPFFINENRFVINNSVTEKIKALQEEHGRFGLFVGRLVGYKGLKTLIEASKKIDHKVIIIGIGPLKEELKNQVIKNELEKKVLLLGRIDDDDEFSAYYRACHYVVLPSISPNENFGMVQLEGMLCEKPIITTNLKSGVPAVGIPGKTKIIVEPGDPIELANQMIELVNNEVYAKRLGKSGKFLYLNKYQKEHVISKTLAIYNLKTLSLQKIKKSA